MWTPWGQSDDSTQYARGIVFYSTPSHGGFHLSAGRLAKMPEHLRSLSGYPDGWYEEDCDWAAVAYMFADELAGKRSFEATAQEVRDNARETLMHWHPELAGLL